MFAPVGQHQVLQLLKFLFLFLISKTTAGMLQQLFKVSSQLDERCVRNATSGTPASTIFTFFKFPKPVQACLQLVKVSSQSDEWCVLL